ncbi:MAG: hypothetical protein ACPGQL_08215 [Thermoplasmatota archaeon]
MIVISLLVLAAPAPLVEAHACIQPVSHAGSCGECDVINDTDRHVHVVTGLSTLDPSKASYCDNLNSEDVEWLLAILLALLPESIDTWAFDLRP